tara:strand:+ start:5003 stop:5500 length:498 start_codon:yes stop_codon:yes gene_type:complete
MDCYPILQYPNTKLREPGKKVEKFDAELKSIVDKMFVTHYAQENCAALAATQLGIPLRITVIDFSETKDQPLCLINPEIVNREGKETSPEGCMSVPVLTAKVTRAEKITVKYFNVKGEEREMTADGFMAKCIQHEIDHLDGILYIDRLSPLKKKMLEMKLRRHSA